MVILANFKIKIKHYSISYLDVFIQCQSSSGSWSTVILYLKKIFIIIRCFFILSHNNYTSLEEGALPKYATIHTAEMTAMREIQKKRGKEMGNIYRLADLNTGHREQENKIFHY